ncbi:hypothetical protein [Pseudomonas sp.]|uniref:hypothetical protein n=1 Tax=Pseudomonas sp. TaxID=306 RepID=UPI00257EC652|nr:hypothetical protein [Pseudomonas sp.]
MSNPIKIFLAGLAIAFLVLIGQLANTYRLESILKELQAQCIEEGKNDKTEWADFELVCDAGSLGVNSTGIQKKVVEANSKVKQSRVLPYNIVAIILAIFTAPLAWYFILARIRELRDVLAGK